MEWGDFSCLIFSSSRAHLQFLASFLLAFFFLFFLSFFSHITPSSFYSSSRCLEVIQRSCQYSQVVQNPWGSFTGLHFFYLTFFNPHPCFPLFSRTLSIFYPPPHPPYYPVVWQAEPCSISLFYLHCASGWHCVLELGYSQVCVCVRARVWAYQLACKHNHPQFMSLKLAWLYVPQSVTHKFLPSWYTNNSCW